MVNNDYIGNFGDSGMKVELHKDFVLPKAQADKMLKFKIPKKFEIDYEKIKDVEDIVSILKCLD